MEKKVELLKKNEKQWISDEWKKKMKEENERRKRKKRNIGGWEWKYNLKKREK